MKDCFEKIEQEDEARVRFKQRRLTLYQYLGRVGMAKDKHAHTDVQRRNRIGFGACLARTFAVKKLIGF